MIPTAYPAATTAAAEQDSHLKPVHYLALALLCAALGTWASFINWEYFTHGARAMEPDEAAREISEGAALMFVVGEMAAFAFASLLPAERLRALRHKLQAFGLAMLVFECATIILTQHGIAASAERRAGANDSRVGELKASIAAQRENAKETRERGKRLAMSTEAGARAQGAALIAKAQAIENKLEGKADEMGRLEGERKPTAIELLGDGKALAYAIARGLLVTTAGLVFFSAAGALVRAARTAGQQGSTAQADAYAQAQAMQAHALAMQAQATAAAAGHPAPMVPVGNITPGPGPAYASDNVRPLRPGQHFGRNMAWALGAVPVMMGAAAMAPRQVQASVPTVPNMAAPWLQVATPAQDANPAPADLAQPKARKAPQRTPTAQGLRMDTGVGELDGYRYRRVRAAVKAGKLRPSVQAIKQAEGGGTQTVSAYLAELHREGLIEPNPSGRGWRLATTQREAA